MRLGKNKQAISLVVFLLLSASVAGQAEKKYKYQLDGNLQKTNVISGNQSIIINYTLPELNIENISNSNGIFYRIKVPGLINTAIPGEPELPVYSRLITIPDDAVCSIKISELKTTRIKPSERQFAGILYPVQEGETKVSQQKEHPFAIDKSIYAKKGLIVTDTVKIVPLGKVRNVNLANLYISPVQYDPHENTLEVITSMKVEILFSYSAAAVSRSLTAGSTLFNESLTKGILNFNPDEVIPGFSEHPVGMIIITDSSFRTQLKPFIKWKTEKGFRLTVLYKGVGLAGNTYTELKDTLTKIYNSSTTDNPPPEYLLIIGDVNHVPYYGSGGTGNITDMYYGEFTGNGDYIPEMYIGRLPVADTVQLNTVVKKLIQYEKFKFADANKFYSQALVFAGYDAEHADYMNGQTKYAITNYLTPANNLTEYHFYYPQSYTAKDSIIKLINNGTSFINYTGHGDETGWLHINNGLPNPVLGIKVADIPSFLNKDMYPFIISNACRTAQFSMPASFGNSLVLSRNKGAIGFIGCSNDSYWDEDYFWSLGPGTISANPSYDASALGAYDRLFHTHGESPSDWYFTMGQIVYAGNLAVSASNTVRKKYYWETYNLVGDPSVIPVLGKPGTFNVSLPDTLPNGLKSLTLSVDPFAYVAVSHSDTLWDASYASTSGTVTLDMPGISNDTCLLVITGQNKYPIIKTVKFSTITREYLNLTSTAINDINGNNNKVADFGESFFLKLKISNLGLTDAQNVYAKISSSSNLITINSDSAFIGTLHAKTDIELSDQLEITVSDDIPDLAIATIDLVLKDQKSEKHYTIDITLHSPQLQVINCLIDDSVLGNDNKIADPGESFNLIFRVQNIGTSDISGQMTVVSQDDNLTILDPSVKSGVIKFGEITDIPVLVKVSSNTTTGSFISVSSALDCTPYIINKDFTFRVGRIRESFEASSFKIFPWINVSSVPWIITGSSSYDGSFSARSGAISHNGSTSLALRTVYSNPDSLKFYYRVSSELNYDFLSFKLNGNEIFRSSGEVPWTKKVIALPAGLNKMEWRYYKDNSQSSGSDCAWIDMIDFAESSPVRYIQKDLELAKIVSPVQKDRFGFETVTVKVLNLGAEVLKGFTLSYEVNQSYPVTEFFENELPPQGDSVTVSFKSRLDLSKYGVYSIKTYGTGNNDDYVNNDTLQVNIENTNILENLSVYPNPFTDQLTVFVNSDYADRLQISLTNITGVQLYNIGKDIIRGDNTIVISGLRLLPSLYYLNIRGTTINKTIPVIKINR
jgi:hypothetical protein